MTSRPNSNSVRHLPDTETASLVAVFSWHSAACPTSAVSSSWSHLLLLTMSEHSFLRQCSRSQIAAAFSSERSWAFRISTGWSCPAARTELAADSRSSGSLMSCTRVDYFLTWLASSLAASAAIEPIPIVSCESARSPTGLPAAAVSPCS